MKWNPKDQVTMFDLLPNSVGSKRKVAEYAVYRGDEFIMLGTAEQCAKELNVKVETIRFQSSPAYKRRLAERGNGGSNALVVIKIEDEIE